MNINNAEDAVYGNKPPIKTSYLINGLVFGNYWGGGRGAYRSTTLVGDNIKELLEQAITKLKDGSLDSGMGYESLIGARLDISVIRKIEIEGRVYKSEEVEIHFIGELTDEEKEWLENLNG